MEQAWLIDSVSISGYEKVGKRDKKWMSLINATEGNDVTRRYRKISYQDHYHTQSLKSTEISKTYLEKSNNAKLVPKILKTVC